VILNLFVNISDCLLVLAQTPLYGFIFNGLTGFASAYIFLRFPLLPDFGSARKYMRFFDDLREENLSKDYLLYTLKYCLAAGIVTAVIAHLQFGKFNLVNAFIYGAAGPYALRKQISEQLFKRPVDRAVGNTMTTSDEIIMEYDKGKDKVSRRLDELAKNYEKTLEENSQALNDVAKD
jgi:hypothetical protein